MDDTALDPLFTQCFDLAKMMFFYVPINPYRRFLGNISSREYLTGVCVYYFVLLCQLLLILLYTIFIVDSLAKGENFLLTVATSVWLILDINSYVITWNIFKSGQAVADLITTLYDSFPKTNEERKSLEVETFTQEWANKMKALRNFFLLGVFGMILSPIIRSVAIYAWTGQWKPELPLIIWLPFEPKAMPIYPFAYAAEIWLFLVNSCIMVAFGATMGGVIILICLQFKKVQLQFSSIKFGEYNADLNALVDAIKIHNRTLELAGKAREAFSVFLFFIFLFSSMVICVFTFLLFIERDPVVTFQYSANSTCFLGYVAMYGYFGDQLIAYSSEIADALYDSNLLDADVRIQKMILLVIERANAPATLTGLGFFFACNPTLSKIITTSYSYFALLMTMYNSMQ